MVDNINTLKILGVLMRSIMKEKYNIETLEEGWALLEKTVGTGVESHLRGLAAELSTEEEHKFQGWEVKKVPDSDKKRRHDFTSTDGVKTITSEVKMCDKRGGVNINLRDGRELYGVKPCKNRTIMDQDYFAINCVNITGKWDDIRYVRVEDVKRARRTKKFMDLTEEEMATVLIGSFNINKVKNYKFTEII